MIDLNIGAFGQEAICLDTVPQFSAADPAVYLNDKELKKPTEDDVLHCLNLPSFDDIMSEEDAEKLLSYMTVPYLRLPLIVQFFATKDRVPVLLNRDIQAILENVLFEPRKWTSKIAPYDTLRLHCL